MKKLLFIRYKKSGRILEGGEQVSQKNFDILARLLGESNIDTVYIHDETRRRGIAEYLKGAFWFPFGYYFGLTPKRVREIALKAEEYDYVFVGRSVFGILAKKLKANGYKGRIISFFHNVEVLYFNAKLEHKPWRFVISRCADKNDRWTCQYSDRMSVCRMGGQLSSSVHIIVHGRQIVMYKRIGMNHFHRCHERMQQIGFPFSASAEIAVSFLHQHGAKTLSSGQNAVIHGLKENSLASFLFRQKFTYDLCYLPVFFFQFLRKCRITHLYFRLPR